MIMTSDPFPAETHWYDLPDDDAEPDHPHRHDLSDEDEPEATES